MQSLDVMQRYNVLSNVKTVMETKTVMMVQTSGIVVSRAFLFKKISKSTYFALTLDDSIDSKYWDHFFRKRPAAQSDDIPLGTCGMRAY